MIVIPGVLLEGIVASARRESPAEVCGWLAGEGRVVRCVRPVANAAEDPEAAFAMAPEPQLVAVRDVRELGMDLVGTYHSHPRTAPVPSARDRDLAAYPEAVHLIVSLAAPEPELRCYQWDGGAFAAVGLAVGAPSDYSAFM